MHSIFSNLGPWDLITSQLLEDNDLVEYTYTVFFDTRHGGGRDPLLDFRKTNIASDFRRFLEDECLKENHLIEEILKNFDSLPDENEILEYLLETMRDPDRDLSVFGLTLIDAGSGICTIEFELKGQTTVEKIRKSRPENVNLLDIFVTTKVCHIQAIPESLNEKNHE